jgi:UDP-N-acetylglucosamine 1-carboxyvinyltransferase
MYTQDLWQQPFVVLLTQAKGTSVLHETVYENRFGYTEMLKEMGADISLFHQCLGDKRCRFASLGHPHSLIVKGKTDLIAKNIAIPDLRAGFAYVMAALIAQGTSEITGLEYLDRGYEDLTGKLECLGVQTYRGKIEEKELLTPIFYSTSIV